MINNKIIVAIISVLVLIIGILTFVLVTQKEEDSATVTLNQKSLISETEASQLAIDQVFNSGVTRLLRECMFAEPYTRFNNSTDFEVRHVKSDACNSKFEDIIETVRVNLETKEVSILDFKSDEKIVKVENYIPAPTLDKNFCDSMTLSSPLLTSTTSGSCSIKVGPNTDLIFSFDNISASTAPRFVLNIFDPFTNYVQQIRLPYNWEYSNHTVNLNDDINFDGYKDMLMKIGGRRASLYAYFTYDSSTKTFVSVESLLAIYTPTFNAKERTITTIPDIANYYVDENGQQQYSTPDEDKVVYKFVDGEYVPSI